MTRIEKKRRIKQRREVKREVELEARRERLQAAEEAQRIRDREQQTQDDRAQEREEREQERNQIKVQKKRQKRKEHKMERIVNIEDSIKSLNELLTHFPSSNRHTSTRSAALSPGVSAAFSPGVSSAFSPDKAAVKQDLGVWKRKAHALLVEGKNHAWRESTSHHLHSLNNIYEA